MCLKIKPFSICEKLDMINKTAEDLGIPVRKVSDKMHGHLDTGENLFRLLQTTQIQHTYVMTSRGGKKSIYIPFKSYPFKRFSHLVSLIDVLGFFRNILREFHCILLE